MLRSLNNIRKKIFKAWRDLEGTWVPSSLALEKCSCRGSIASTPNCQSVSGTGAAAMLLGHTSTLLSIFITLCPETKLYELCVIGKQFNRHRARISAVTRGPVCLEEHFASMFIKLSFLPWWQRRLILRNVTLSPDYTILLHEIRIQSPSRKPGTQCSLATYVCCRIWNTPVSTMVGRLDWWTVSSKAISVTGRGGL
jgi:hypothetical protein